MAAFGKRRDATSEASLGRVSAQEQRLFQELLEEHCGVTQGLGSRAFLERKLMPRVEALGLNSLEDYYRYLRYDDQKSEELEVFVDRLTTHETYFFREEQQLELLYEHVIPQWAKCNPRSPLRVWSAGCSTGEEVYSLAILLSEHPALSGREFEVVGTDISREVIRRAREACYSSVSFRCTPPHLKKRYFHAKDDLSWCVNANIRARCSFGQLNLIDTERYGVLGQFDVIFCRNVLIYFASDRRPAVISGFHEALNREGYLFLGHSESLLNLSTQFYCLHLDKGLVYRRDRGEA